MAAFKKGTWIRAYSTSQQDWRYVSPLQREQTE